MELAEQARRAYGERVRLEAAELAVRVAAASARVAVVDPDGLRAGAPDSFERWRSGRLSPGWITRELNRCRFPDAWVDETLQLPPGECRRLEAGLVYPSWTTTCRIAAMVDVPLSEALNVDPRKMPLQFGRGGRFGCTVTPDRFYLARAYHPAIVAATVEFEDDPDGFAAAHPNALEQAIADGKVHGDAALEDFFGFKFNDLKTQADAS